MSRPAFGTNAICRRQIQQDSETNLKSFATAGFRDYKAHVAGNANVPGSIMEKAEDLKAADEMVEWLLA